MLCVQYLFKILESFNHCKKWHATTFLLHCMQVLGSCMGVYGHIYIYVFVYIYCSKCVWIIYEFVHACTAFFFHCMLLFGVCVCVHVCTTFSLSPHAGVCVWGGCVLCVTCVHICTTFSLSPHAGVCVWGGCVLCVTCVHICTAFSLFTACRCVVCFRYYMKHQQEDTDLLRRHTYCSSSIPFQGTGTQHSSEGKQP